MGTGSIPFYSAAIGPMYLRASTMSSNQTRLMWPSTAPETVPVMPGAISYAMISSTTRLGSTPVSR